MKIRDIFFTKGVSGFFFDDQRAIKEGAVRDGFLYRGHPVTPGFKSIRMAGESVGVCILQEGAPPAFGDCCAVQYSGAGGREALFLAEVHIPLLEKSAAPLLRGRDFSSFREASGYIDRLSPRGRPLHTAVRYGISQALLDAFAGAEGLTATEILAREYSLPLKAEPVRILGQCGDSRFENVDKMIMKKVDVLPHGLINSIDEKFGRKGEKLSEYVSWIKNRLLEIREEESYFPEIHLDVYGLPGLVFDNDIGRISEFIAGIARAARPFALRVEGPLDAGSRDGQVELMKALTSSIDRRGIPAEIVSDEWCNTLSDISLFASEKAGHMLQIKTPDLGGIGASVEAVSLCGQKGVRAYLGGTCNETDVSARVCAHAAMASRPYQTLAKPGMGFDEGYMVVYNEMQRIISILEKNYGRE